MSNEGNEVDGLEELDMAMNGADQSKRGDNKAGWSAFVMDLIVGLLSSVLCGFFLYWSFEPDGVVLFAWHPALLTIGFILFMTSAINIFNNGFFSKSYSKRVTAHWVLHTISIICITGGFAAIVWNKIRLDKHHFHTPHAIVGLVTFVLMFLVAIGGIVAKYSFNFRRKIRPIILKLTHSNFGLIIYWLGGVALILGLYSNWFKKHRSSIDSYFAFTAIILIWLYTSLRPLGQIFRRLRQVLTSI